jgi:hypothetical protein
MIGDLEALDLVDLEADVVIRHVRGGSVFACLFADTLERLQERMLTLGAADEDLAAAQRLLRDPCVAFRAPTVTTAWGPAAELSCTE